MKQTRASNSFLNEKKEALLILYYLKNPNFKEKYHQNKLLDYPGAKG